MTTAKPIRLKDWAAEHASQKRPLSFVQKLPEEIREQIRESATDPDISGRDVVAWLHSIGYEDATEHRISRFLTDVRNGRA